MSLHFGYEGELIPWRTWAMLFESPHRQLRESEVGPYLVSTVWLGLDHGFGRSEKPIIFETMVFEKEQTYSEPVPPVPEMGLPGMPGFLHHKDFDQRRYATQEEALAGHEALVNEISLLVAANPEWRVEGDGYAPVDTD